ncbi:MAG: crotonase/enoyl-CoA hydratase family protein [Gammaproteobacteria bacterium]|nr:crotonase/enoyl-CoA hydratase family protein [Gammaproteobacteria bacterium]
MEYTTFDLSINDHVAHLRFNRPQKYNTMSVEFWQEFPHVIKTIDEGGDARVLVISGEGKHFCAGMDLAVFTSGAIKRPKDPARRNEHMRQLVLQLQAIISNVEDMRIPVLAAIQGGAIGGALDLVCACDCRYMSEDAFVSIEEIRLGMAADLGTLQRLPRLIAPGLAKELAYTGRRMMSDEALASGLVNQVFSNSETMLIAVMALAKTMASHSPLAVHGCKEIINYGRDHSIDNALKYQATWQAGMLQPEVDMMEAMMSKAQKRTPEYKALEAKHTAFNLSSHAEHGN